MIVDIWVIFILGIMIVGSIVALEQKNVLSAIITVGIVGLGTSMIFLFLQAPDLAVVQFLFEIFAMVIMIRAFIKPDYHKLEPSGINKVMTFITIVVLAGFLYLSIDMLKNLPKFGEPKMTTSSYYVEDGHGAKETHSANIVTAIILDYRAFDTLGEATVLFTSILGVLTILRIRTKKRKSEEAKE